MRLVTYDDLQPEWEASRAATQLSAFGSFLPKTSIEAWRKQGSLSDYVGVFAVEREQVIGHAITVRLPYTYPDGAVHRISGVAMVGSRPDESGRGIARRILEEIHRRERRAGFDHITLWTNRSWGSHGIYERLGYHDIFQSPVAVSRLAQAPARSKPPQVRPATPADLPVLDRLHGEATHGRWGFTPRPPNFLVDEHRIFHTDPKTNFLVAREGRRVTGFARVDADKFRAICRELVVTRPSAAEALIGAVEQKAPMASVAAFTLSSVRDQGEELRGRGYFFVPAGWYVLMARPLRGEGGAKEVAHELGTDDPRWVVHAGDQF